MDILWIIAIACWFMSGTVLLLGVLTDIVDRFVPPVIIIFIICTAALGFL